VLKTDVLDGIIIFSDGAVCRMKILEIFGATWKEHFQHLTCQVKGSEEAAGDRLKGK
jgi:hypothetical protein